VTILHTLRNVTEYAGFKIFAVSGHTPEEFGLDRGASKIDRWFQKPVHPEELLRELNAELQREGVAKPR